MDYEYKVKHIAIHHLSDEMVAKEIEKVINEYSLEGWSFENIIRDEYKVKYGFSNTTMFIILKRKKEKK